MSGRDRFRIFHSPLLIVAAFILLLPAITPRLNASDEVEFFSWLHSVAFDRDADFTNEYQHFYDTGPMHNAGFHETFLERLNEKGLPNNFTPVGTALLWAPFYGVAHLVAGLTGAPQDGYSRPYITAVTFASALYGMLALLLSHAITKRVLGTPAITATMAVWIGTPLVFYMYIAPGFGHACSAFAVALCLWTWLRVRESWTPLGAAALGITAALLPMVREQDGFFLAGPALDFLSWAVAGSVVGTAANAVVRPVTRPPLIRVLAAGAAGLIACGVTYLPQAWGYLALNGHVGPAHVVSRKMTWTAPYFTSVLLSPAHGFFIWTPLAVLALSGLIGLAAGARIPGARRDARWLALLALVMFLLQAYVSGSVESWTVAGSFGQRRFVALTPLLVLGLSAIILTTAAHRAGRLLTTAAVALCLWWNLGLMAQFGLHIMDRQQLTPAENARVTFLHLPAQLPSLAWRYLFDRESFFGLQRQ